MAFFELFGLDENVGGDGWGQGVLAFAVIQHHALAAAFQDGHRLADVKPFGQQQGGEKQIQQGEDCSGRKSTIIMASDKFNHTEIIMSVMQMPSTEFYISPLRPARAGDIRKF